MIIFENKGFQTNSMFPNSDWTGKALYVIKDDSELANKIKKLFPHYDFVLDDKRNLIDVVPVKYEPEEPEDTDENPTEVEQLRADVDFLAIMTGVEL